LSFIIVLKCIRQLMLFVCYGHGRGPAWRQALSGHFVDALWMRSAIYGQALLETSFTRDL